MRGVGGPLLCIGDLLNDVAADDGAVEGVEETPPPLFTTASLDGLLEPSDLQRLFEENYEQLIESLSGSDHSWTALMLKVLSLFLGKLNYILYRILSRSNAGLLLEKVKVLEGILKKGDSAIAAAKALHTTHLSKEVSSTTSLEATRPRD
ncbi:uncharacterized protein [Typha latifolia]|uniref:uncharacterized protein isoform X1 n=1 Tax=Typha latifolia TaxID=4733 RepID=UPI003C2BF9CB